ncbi:hypothetical protein [Acinetobacter sp. SEK570]|uniref:hypothetical protein n=1 Tax=unclassified Acinetobacter TaxID=196816 RepID=UPI0039A160F6
MTDVIDTDIGIKISELNETTSFGANDVVPVVQGGMTRKIKRSKIFEAFIKDLGTAALSSVDDFAGAGAIDELTEHVDIKANEQNERIERIEYSMYLMRNNGVYKAYRTKALMIADAANIPADSITTVVDDPSNDAEKNDINGQYHYDGRNFFKLPDLFILTESMKKYVEKVVEGLSFDAIYQFIEELLDIVADGQGWTDLLVSTVNHRSQREKNLEFATLKDFAGIDTAEQLYNALSTDKLIEIRENVLVNLTTTDQARRVLSKLENLIVCAPTTITLPPSVTEFNSNYITKYTKDHALLTIKGAEPIAATINSVVSASGGDGLWDVTYEFADASNIQLNDYIKIDKVACGSAWFESSPIRKTMLGELNIGMNKMGAASTSGNKITLGSVGPNGFPSNWLDVGDLLHFKGQTRKITSFDDDLRTITVATAFDSGSAEDEFDTDSIRYQWWYLTKPNQGKISVVGANVTGVDTNFTAIVNDGDIILVDGSMVQVKSVESDTQLTINLSMHNIALTDYSVIKAGLIAHEGTWKVIAKSGNNVTVKLKCWNGYHPETNTVANKFAGFAPTVKGWKGADVKVMKTVLKQNQYGGHGFVGEQGGQVQFINNIVLDGTVSGTGILLKGEGAAYDAKNSNIILGANVAVCGFNFSVWGFNKSHIHSPSAHFVGSNSHSVHLGDGGSGYLRGSVVAGAGGMGLFIAGGYVRLSTCRLIGSKSQALRSDAGGNYYSDSGFIYGNGSHGIMAVNISGGQFVDGFSLCNGGNGVNTQNGGSGRYTRLLAGCNKNHGMSFTASVVEAGQCWTTGSGSGALTGRSGTVANNSQVALFAGTSTGNPSTGLLALDCARVASRNFYTSKNGQSGVSSQHLSQVIGVGGYAEGNYGPNNVVTSNGGVVTGFGTTPSAQLNGAIHTGYTALSNGGVITLSKSTSLAYVFGEIEIFNASSAGVKGKAEFRAGTSPNTSKISGHANFAVTTGVMDGTNGPAGNLIVSTHTDGKIYIANQTGSAMTISYLIKGNVL